MYALEHELRSITDQYVKDILAIVDEFKDCDGILEEPPIQPTQEVLDALETLKRSLECVYCGCSEAAHGDALICMDGMRILPTVFTPDIDIDRTIMEEGNSHTSILRKNGFIVIKSGESRVVLRQEEAAFIHDNLGFYTFGCED